MGIPGVGTFGAHADMGAHEHNGTPTAEVVAFGESLYWYSEGLANAQGAAASICGQFGATLVTLQDADENALVQSLLAAPSWAGGYHDTGTTWLWYGAQPMPWVNWSGGAAPNGSGGQCLVLNHQSGQWSADACTVVRPFVCEQAAF